LNSVISSLSKALAGMQLYFVRDIASIVLC
jgi:hypothetical protein